MSVFALKALYLTKDGGYTWTRIKDAVSEVRMVIFMFTVIFVNEY